MSEVGTNKGLIQLVFVGTRFLKRERVETSLLLINRYPRPAISLLCVTSNALLPFSL